MARDNVGFCTADVGVVALAERVDDSGRFEAVNVPELYGLVQRCSHHLFRTEDEFGRGNGVLVGTERGLSLHGPQIHVAAALVLGADHEKVVVVRKS